MKRARLPRLGACLLLLAAGCIPVQTFPFPSATFQSEHDIHDAHHVAFPSRDADLHGGVATTIDGWLFRPVGAGPFPAVIELPDCAGLYTRVDDMTPTRREWAKSLVAQGYVVLLPDSLTARGFAEICTRDEPVVRASFERDAYGALQYLQSLPWVRADRTAVVGWSDGGTAVLAMLAHRSPARPPDLPAYVRVGISFYPACDSALERADWMPPVAPLAILIGEKDEWAPAPPCVALAARAATAGAPVSAKVYPGATHDFDTPVEGDPYRFSGIAEARSHTVTIAPDPEARRDAFERVRRILRGALGP